MQLSDLEHAFLFVSAGHPGEHEAFVDRRSGRVWYVSEMADVEESPPEDLDDPERYAEVPHQHDLDLGKALAHRFAEAESEALTDATGEALRQRGGWRRFRELLNDAGRLEAWYTFEAEETEAALRAWAAEERIPLEAAGG